VKQQADSGRSQVAAWCDELHRQIDETRTRLLTSIDHSEQVYSFYWYENSLLLLFILVFSFFSPAYKSVKLCALSLAQMNNLNKHMIGTEWFAASLLTSSCSSSRRAEYSQCKCLKFNWSVEQLWCCEPINCNWLSSKANQETWDIDDRRTETVAIRSGSIQ
jgi:hypothetical protein